MSAAAGYQADETEMAARVASLYRGGMTQDEVSAELGVSRRTVRRLLTSQGVASRAAAPRIRSEHERFWTKVKRGQPHECWPWLAARQPDGYGLFHTSDGRHWGAHRYAYEVTYGPIPQCLVIDHVRARGCNRTDCVNPAHLEAVTQAVNIERGINRAVLSASFASQTHCRHGHELTPENTYVRPIGNGQYRRCRKCRSVWRKEYRKRGAA
jgi:transposase